MLQNGKFETFRKKPETLNTISSDFIEATIIDRSGHLWIGTHGGGLTKSEKSKFISFEDRFGKIDNSESPSYVRSIAEDKQGRIWFGTHSDIFVYDGKTTKNVVDIYPQFPSLKTTNSIFCDSKGNIWIAGGTEWGLHQFDGKVVHDRSIWPGIDFRNYFLNKIMQSSDGTIWVGCSVQGGFHGINDGKIKTYLHDPTDPNSISYSSAYCSIEASDGTIWVGTTRGGLNAFRDGIFRRYYADEKDPNSLSNNAIHSLLEASDGSVWAATESGLNRYRPETDDFEKYFKKDGLINNTVLSLAEDSLKRIWIGAQNGISRFDPRLKSFQNFDSNSGIYAHPFQRNSMIIKSGSNEIIVGGVNGVISFKTDEISDQLDPPNVRITNFLLNSMPVEIGDESILKQAIERTKKIEVDRFDGTITFEYSDMKYRSGPGSQYAYKMDGFESGWNYVGESQAALYSNLPGGSFRFMVKSSTDGVVWGEPAMIGVVIIPNWWETTWFKILLVVTLMGLVSFYFAWRFKFYKQQREKLVKLVDDRTRTIQEQNAQILSKSKELTSKNSKLEKTMKQLKELQDQRILVQAQERLNISREVHDGISQSLFILRFIVNSHLNKSKSYEEMICVPREVDQMLDGLIRETRIILNNLAVNFMSQPTFKESLIHLIDMSRKVGKVEITLDWRGDDHITTLAKGTNIFRIMQEALSNSLRHSDADLIEISVQNDDVFEFTIEDDGKGFENSNEEPQGYGLKNMKGRAKELEAVLDVDSKPGEGTKVTLTI